MQHMLLHNASARDALVLDHAPVAMPLAVLVANLMAQKHGGAALFTDRAMRKYPWSALQPLSAASPNPTQAISIACAITKPKNRQKRRRIGKVRIAYAYALRTHIRKLAALCAGGNPPSSGCRFERFPGILTASDQPYFYGVVLGRSFKSVPPRAGLGNGAEALDETLQTLSSRVTAKVSLLAGRKSPTNPSTHRFQQASPSPVLPDAGSRRGPGDCSGFWDGRMGRRARERALEPQEPKGSHPPPRRPP